MTGHHGGRKDGLLDILGRGGCHFFLILSFMFYGQAYGNACSDIISTESVWDAGQTGTMHLKFPQSVSSWHVKVTFTAPVSDFQVWVGGNIQCSGLSCEFDNMDWDGNIEAGQILDVPYLMYFSSASEINGIILLGVQLCGNNGDDTTPNPHTTAHPTKPTNPDGPTGTTAHPTKPTNPTGPTGTTAHPTKPTNPTGPTGTTAHPTKPTNPTGPTGTTAHPTKPTNPTGPTGTTAHPTHPHPTGTTAHPTNPTTTQKTTPTTSRNGPCVQDKYGFAEAIDKSLLFYEAQRSGDLPESEMRIKWRKDSAMNDRGNNGEDLTGGYYDAGDFVKFGFPMAESMTLLAWGGIAYKDGYAKAGMLEYLRDAVKWGTDYFIKAHVSPNEFYGQVGDGYADHASWGRPEDMNMARPAFKIDASHPGSDLACETAAALAAASILFRDADASYSAELLTHAEQLYEFGDSHRGVYSDVITNAADFYKSWNGYNDELVWGALWLHKATGDESYLNKAKQYYSDFELEYINEVFSWDDKVAGAKVLLAEATGSSQYVNAMNDVCEAYKSTPKSPGGRSHFMQWGSNRYASNAAFICLRAADISGDNSFTEYALGQIEYMLGSTGRSFVCGFGNNPPTHPHHRSSSCPSSGSCDWNNFNNPGPNPQTLYGALVGGPQNQGSDQISDRRDDYVESEVTTDYNAGFQSTLAGLLARAC